jgi:hypothetical protein
MVTSFIETGTSSLIPAQAIRWQALAYGKLLRLYRVHKATLGARKNGLPSQTFRQKPGKATRGKAEGRRQKAKAEWPGKATAQGKPRAESRKQK